MAQLPCDSNGVCMVCKSLPTEEEKLVCFTCVTPWHVACLSSLPPTLASTINWLCPDCSNPNLITSPPPPGLAATPGVGDELRNLVLTLKALETDASLSREEKNKKQQDVMSGKAGKAVEEEDKDKNNIDKSIYDILTKTLRCPICIQLPERPVTTPCGHTFCLKCFEKWIRQGKRTCITCRQGIPAKMVNQPRINSALVYAIRIAKKDDNNGRISGPSGVPPYTDNKDKPDQPYTTDRAQRKGRANAASGKIFVTVPTDHFGPIPPENDPLHNKGLLVGDSWPDRLECRQWGAHFLPIGGIAGQSDRGAQSVVLSGGYLDDEDHGEWFLYTGSGGKDLSGNKRTNKNHSFDQKFEKYNRALQISCQEGYPVRVVRSHKEKRSSYAPESGVRYDGIYRIEKCWQIAGQQGFKVCRYLFVRCDNEPSPWTSDDRGDRPKPLPIINELKKATAIFERTKFPAWDFDEEDSCWKWKKLPPPSKKKVQIEEPTKIEKSSKEIRKFQKMSIKEQLRKGFSCQICRQVMDSPVTTPCGHNFCKSCLEGAFAGQAFVRERNIGGRTLRSQKNVMKCPTCTIDISDYLQNLQVDIGLKGAIESLKAKVEENGETLEASEDVDRFQEDGAKETSKATDSTVKHGAKNKKIDSTEQLPEMGDDGKMAKRHKSS